MKHEKCANCGDGLVGQRSWYNLSLEERRAARAGGRNVHIGHGLCKRCHSRARRAGTLPEQPSFVPLDVILEDWPLIVNKDLSQKANIRLAAPRLGMSESALEQALLRAKRLGLLERAA